MITKKRKCEIERELDDLEREIERIRRELIARRLRHNVATIPPSCAPSLSGEA